MAITCVNTNHSEFVALQERSGLNDFILEVNVAKYLDEHNGRFPKLDELPGVNSEPHLRDFLKINKTYNTAPIREVLEKVGASSIEEALIKLNARYNDLRITGHKIADKFKFDISPRPSMFTKQNNEPVEFNLSNTTFATFMSNALSELSSQMGIQVHKIDARGIVDLGLNGISNDILSKRAFIYNGDIYVRTDVEGVDIDAPIHELMHVLMGAVKITNPDLYYQLITASRLLENYQNTIELNPNRSQLDLEEEMFVEEYARMLTGLSSKFDLLDKDLIYIINYEMSRALDTMLDGDVSVKVIPAMRRFSLTWKLAAQTVNSHNMQDKFSDIFDAVQAHRVLANVKEKLMKSGELKEECN